MLNRFLAVALIAATALDAQEPRYWKGNLHTHSLWSDGDNFPESIAAWYREHGWQFLAFTEHNTIANREKWIANDDVIRRGGRSALAQYRERFGNDWVETRDGKDGKLEVRLKQLGEFRGRFEESGRFLLVQSEELTDVFDKRPIHINVTNIASVIRPQGGASVSRVIDRNLEQVAKQAASLGRPILPHLNHPNFGWGVTAEDLASVIAERYFEVYNGHPSVHHEGDAKRAGLEKLWDVVCTLRIDQYRAPPPFGLATDDSHAYFVEHITKANSGRGWVQVRAKSLATDALMESLIRGDFYASSGVTLRDVRFRDGELFVEIDPVAGESYEVAFVGTREGYDGVATPVVGDDGKALAATWKYSADIGEVFAKVSGLTASYRLTGDELYVRAVITSTATPSNPSFEGQRQQAWTQPVGWRRRVAEEPVQFGAVVCGGVHAGPLRGIDVDHSGSIYWSYGTELVRSDASGSVIASRTVSSQHGDLCVHGGKVFAAVTVGAADGEHGAIESRVLVYDGRNLDRVGEFAVPDVVHGAAGITWRGGRFVVVGGLPAGATANLIYEYDEAFRLLATRSLPGPTPDGIRTACFGDQRFWFGCLGEPRTMLVADGALQPWAQVEFDCAEGVAALPAGRFLVGNSVHDENGRWVGRVFVAEPNVGGGLVRCGD